MTNQLTIPVPHKGWLPLVLITFLTVAILIISVISLVSGWLTIFQNLFYFPIILACVYYVKRGFFFSVLLACGYFVLMLIFTNDPVVLQGALIRVLIFILVAGVITYVSIIRIRAEDALKESEEFNRGLVENMPNLVVVYDHDRKIRYVNPSATSTLGYSVEEMEGTDIMAYVNPRQQTEIAAAIEERFSSDRGKSLEIDLITKAGQHLTVISKGAPLHFQNQPAVLVLFADITDRKRAQEALRQSEERYRSLYADSRDAVMIVSPDREFLAANPATVRLFACKNEQDFTNHTPASLSPEFQPDGTRSEDKAQEMMQLALKKGSHFFEWTHRRVDGTDFPATVLLSRLESGGTQFLQATVRDITDRKRAEEALYLTNTLLSTQMEVAIEGILAVDELGKIIIYNHRFTEIWGIPPEVIASRADERVLQSVLDKLANPEEFLTRVRYLYAHREEKSIEEVLLNDGRVLERYSAPMYGENNQYYGRVWHFRDITDQKKAEQEITRIAHEWETTFNATSDGICLIDANQNLIRCNTRMSEILGGIRQEDLAGKSCCVVVHKTQGPIPECPFVSAKKTLKRIRVEIPDGDLWFEVTVDPILDSSGTFAGAVHIMRDITDRKRAQEALRQLSADHKAIIDHAPAMIWYKDTKNTFVRVNPTCARVFGMAIEEIEGKSTYQAGT